MIAATPGSDGVLRCSWGNSAPEYPAYHDLEWGFPVADDRLLFEKLCLEGFQSGLSWITILRRRPGFRAAFFNFDIERVASMTEVDIERLLQDTGIIRHRGKIESTINNASRALELAAEFGSLGSFFWRYEPGADRGASRNHDAGIDCNGQGSQAAGFPVCRADHRLRLHAGDGHRQRPRAGVLVLHRLRGRSSRLRQTGMTRSKSQLAGRVFLGSDRSRLGPPAVLEYDRHQFFHVGGIDAERGGVVSGLLDQFGFTIRRPQRETLDQP